MSKSLIVWIVLGVVAVIVFKNFGKIKSKISSVA